MGVDSDALKMLAKSLSDRLDTSTVSELFDHGEWLVGLEVLADNVYELDVELSPSERASAVALLEANDWEAGNWVEPILTLLAAGPVGPHGRYRERVLALSYGSQSPERLQEVLAAALGFPPWYGRNWNAFRDAITGLVSLPHGLVLLRWDELANRLPAEAAELLDCLLNPSESDDVQVEVVLRTSSGAQLDPAQELSRLRAPL